jgi:MerR family mercuric resistance operon transcriptional regulator
MRKNQQITIGQLAEVCGINIDTIRYYERCKLLKPESRTKSGYRIYGQESIRLVDFIKRCKSLGFTLDEIGKLLMLKSSKDATCAEMLERTHAKVEDAKRQVKELSRIESALTKLAKACPGGDIPIGKCPILNHLYPDKINQKYCEG